MAEKGKLGYQIFMIAFLLMIVIGFTLPGILDGNTNTPISLEPRVCQHDADCYLTCDDTPLAVLCAQNLCQQNSCEELSLYPFQQQPIHFTLDITILGEKLSLANRTNSNNFFAAFSGSAVQSFSSLPLGVIVEKANLALLGQCLSADGTQYCTDENKELSMLVNGEPSYQYEQYLPKEGDEITLTYGDLSSSIKPISK